MTRSLLMLYENLADHCRSNRLGMACIDALNLAWWMFVWRVVL